MTTRLSAIPVIADWSAIQYANECGYNPKNRYGADQNVGSDAKSLDWKDATVEGED